MQSDNIKLIKCPRCDGTGQEWVHDARFCSSNWGYKKPIVLGSYATCIRCGGVGLVAEVLDEHGTLWHQSITPMGI